MLRWPSDPLEPSCECAAVSLVPLPRIQPCRWAYRQCAGLLDCGKWGDGNAVFLCCAVQFSESLPNSISFEPHKTTEELAGQEAGPHFMNEVLKGLSQVQWKEHRLLESLCRYCFMLVTKPAGQR